MDKLTIGGREFSSRLFVGSGKFSSNDAMLDAILESGSEMITVAMKRLDTSDAASDDMLKHINREHVQFLPNTSGVRNADEAVLAAQLSRDCFGTNFIKLEIHPDPKYLLPDPVETLKATETRLRGAALHPSRPCALQTAGRRGYGGSDASRSAYRHQQGTDNARDAPNNNRPDKRAGGGRRRTRSAVACCRGDGDGCRRGSSTRLSRWLATRWLWRALSASPRRLDALPILPDSETSRTTPRQAAL